MPNPLTALVIENKPIYSAALTTQLLNLGFKVIKVVHTPAKAKAYLAHHSPSLVVANVELLQGRDGLACWRSALLFCLHDGSQLEEQGRSSLFDQDGIFSFPSRDADFKAAVAFVLSKVP